MVAQLPTPGPNDSWGGQLNAYLQELRADTWRKDYTQFYGEFETASTTAGEISSGTSLEEFGEFTAYYANPWIEALPGGDIHVTEEGLYYWCLRFVFDGPSSGYVAFSTQSNFSTMHDVTFVNRGDCALLVTVPMMAGARLQARVFPAAPMTVNWIDVFGLRVG